MYEAIVTALLWSMHCKDKIPKFRNKYSQKRYIGVSVPVSTFMSLCAIYIFPRSVCLFCWRKYVNRSWDYINRSQTHECENWDWGRAIPRRGIHKWDFNCSVDASSGSKKASWLSTWYFKIGSLDNWHWRKGRQGIADNGRKGRQGYYCSW